MNINEKNKYLGQVRSVIRDMYEYGNMRSSVVGRENVFDFSLGNPSIPTPKCIDDTIKELVLSDSSQVHAYTSAPGNIQLRSVVADSIKKRFGVNIELNNIYITCGAAASLTISLGAVCNEGDEVIVFAPFFPEYKVFIEGCGAKFVAVDADFENFQINFEGLKKAISPKTKAVIVNSPNNPSGAVLTEETVIKLSQILCEKEREYGHNIYIIADEPYRELVYDKNTIVPYFMNYYKNTIVCYSYSKSLSLPGERIGYIAICPTADNADDLFYAVCGAGRALGFVCAPSLIQQVIAKNIDAIADIEAYRKNRDLLYNALTEYGYECVRPDGAFYLFVKAPGGDANAFCEAAKAYDLLLVPSDSFGCKGYVRISYCVTENTIKRSLSIFEKLIGNYK